MVHRRRVAVLIVALVATSAGPLWLWRRDPIRQLVRGAPPDARVLEARLSGGFAWAPVRPAVTKASALGGALRFRATVAGVLDEARDHESVTARHAAAIGLLLQKRSRPALAMLDELVKTPEAANDAAIWSDLAAARCDVARTEQNPELFAECLAAADTALLLDDDLQEARFNRALVLDQLGLRDLAREAWLAYAESEPDRGWAGEGRERAERLAAIPPFRKILNENWKTLANDPAAVRELARSQRTESRRWSETMILRWWAEAVRSGDTARAAECLRIARAIGDELVRTGGDAMVQRAVAAIDQAGPRLPHLVEGHILFGEGQQFLINEKSIAEGRRVLQRAVHELELGGSPVALIAESFVSQTYHYLADLPEARRRQKALLAKAAPDLAAFRAQILWQLGLGHQSDGDWTKAMKALTEALTIYERIGEAEHAANVRGLMAEIHDRTGDPDAAWRERIILLRHVGRETGSRQQLWLDSAARAAIMRKQWMVARSFVALSSDIAGRIERPVTEVETNLLRARVSARLGRTEEAEAAIGAARAAATLVSDRLLGDRATADIMAVEAIITPVPQRAIELLDDAIEFQQTRGRRIRVPDMLLSRGRAYHRIGDRRRAEADFEAGIAELERQRLELPSGAPRWGIFQAAEELFEEAISLALEERDPVRAFRYAERARARELYDALRVASPPAQARVLSRDVALVEYVALPDRLVTFVITAGRLSVTTQKVDRELLADQASALTREITSRPNAAPVAARALYDRLIAPIASSLPEGEVVAIVPGPPLAAIPFAALRAADGSFLVKRHAVVSAPSAAVFAELSAEARPIGKNANVLVIANPISGDDLAPLPASEREASALSRMYGQVESYTRDAATADAFRRSAAGAEIIHLATHGVPGGAQNEPALVLTGGRLGIAAIASAALPRTSVVIAAACGSGTGASRAEGMISVARAFLEAGVPSVVSTLWSIDDGDAARFFPLLHQRLKNGLPPAQALRAAQLEAIRIGMPPAIWAAVECMGSGGVAEQQQTEKEV